MRGLYAATRFESARPGTVTFTLAGDVKDAWVDGVPVKSGAQFIAEVRAGTNTLVVQLNEAGVAAGIKLSATDVSFNSN